MVSTLAKPITRSCITTEVVDYVANEARIHSIRTAVFVNEQSIPPELEVDSDDWVSKHVLACYEGKVVGTGRLTPAGRIGRVAVSRPIRRRGVGFCIMQKLLEVAVRDNHSEVILSAQYQAVRFYEKLGFQQEGDIFMDVGIAHIMMHKKLSENGIFNQ